MACALGMETCKRRYKTRYIRLPDLLLELDIARTDGTYKRIQAKYAAPVLENMISRTAAPPHSPIPEL